MAMQMRMWSNTYGHAFRDRCVVARKYERVSKQQQNTSASNALRAPGAPGFTSTAREVLNLRAARNIGAKKGWSERVLTEAERSGEVKHMLVGRDFVDGENESARNKFNSAEVRVQEFIDRQLNGIGTRPQKVQATFMATAAMMCAPNVAGEEWRHVGPQICRQRQWPYKKTYRMFLASAPRRFGKTRFVTMMMINYALSIPGVPVIIFSTSQATSNLLRQDLQVILKEAKELEFAGKRYKLEDLIGSKNNQNEWRFRSPYNPDVESIVYFNPGLNPNNADKHRGKGNHPCTLVILEEMAFLDSRAFVNVVQPIMSMVRALMIGISSPAVDEFNFFTRLQDIRFPNSKQHVCLTVKAELACKRCKRLNAAQWCTHYNSMLPDWVSSTQQYVSRLIMKELNMEDAIKRELGGMVATAQNSAFDRESVKRLCKRELFHGAQANRPAHVGIFIDPNAGGLSEFAVITLALVNGAFVVCYCEHALLTTVYVLSAATAAAALRVWKLARAIPLRLHAFLVHALVYLAFALLVVFELQRKQLVAEQHVVVRAQIGDKVRHRHPGLVQHVVAVLGYAHAAQARKVLGHPLLQKRFEQYALARHRKVGRCRRARAQPRQQIRPQHRRGHHERVADFLHEHFVHARTALLAGGAYATGAHVHVEHGHKYVLHEHGAAPEHVARANVFERAARDELHFRHGRQLAAGVRGVGGQLAVAFALFGVERLVEHSVHAVVAALVVHAALHALHVAAHFVAVFDELPHLRVELRVVHVRRAVLGAARLRVRVRVDALFVREHAVLDKFAQARAVAVDQYVERLRYRTWQSALLVRARLFQLRAVVARDVADVPVDEFARPEQHGRHPIGMHEHLHADARVRARVRQLAVGAHALAQVRR